MLTTSFIEVDGHPVGIVWHEDRGYYFISATAALTAMEGAHFPTLRSAEDAAAALLRRESPQISS